MCTSYGSCAAVTDARSLSRQPTSPQALNATHYRYRQFIIVTANPLSLPPTYYCYRQSTIVTANPLSLPSTHYCYH
ncbi:hypothetical protein BDZ45DRAFT_755501 [Acephala macrosclerotiorum]|nr:hypothetical protein BDZ45DRAFT_755501 [Acephala macrosclerotiorum]